VIRHRDRDWCSRHANAAPAHTTGTQSVDDHDRDRVEDEERDDAQEII